MSDNQLQINKTYIFDGYENNPFEQLTATVIAVKDGWVSYKMRGGTEKSLRIEDFKCLYPSEKVEETQ